MSSLDLVHFSRLIRTKIVEMSYKAQTPHLASALSCVDILIAAYCKVLKINPQNADDPDRDRFILSKGHAVSALYAMLAHRGFFSVAELENFNVAGGQLAEQPFPGCMPGVELATGSLGHGLSVGLGMALSARIQKKTYRTFVIVSDGECNEGTVWEAAMLAPALQLGHLAVIVDYNKWQATGKSNQTMSLDPFVDKWRAFGWNAFECDGHDISKLADLMNLISNSDKGQPLAIVAHTIKGKGVSFMENNNNWHYRSPNKDELAAAKRELEVL